MYSFDSHNGWTFHFNGDYSGDIIISPPNSSQELIVNGYAMIDFALNIMKNITVNYLEGKN